MEQKIKNNEVIEAQTAIEPQLTIFQKLQKVRKELLEEEIKKSGENTSGFKFTYFELKDFLPTATKLFDKYGLTPVFNIAIDNNGIEYASLDIYDGINKIEFTCPTAEAKGNNPIQQQGAKITYMRRYMYLIALDIVENDIVDAQDQKEVAKTAIDYCTKYQFDQIKQYGKLIAQELSEMKITTTNQIKSLTVTEADKLVQLINERLVNAKE